MRTARWVTAAAIALACVIAPATPGAARAPSPAADAVLRVYTGSLTPAQVATLREVGLDHVETDLAPGADGRVPVEVILSATQARKLAAQGVPLTVRPDPAPGARARAAGVFRPYAGPGGLRAELAQVAAAHRGIAKLVTVGHTVRGVPIQAVKVTRDARRLADGRRPAVLYLGAQHAREWITPEMMRRLLHHVVDGYGTDAALTRLVDTTELWFLPVANPDGYDFTFTDGNRQWRKNLRDNDRDGRITPGDGVDLNRNFPYKWGYDNEGSSPDPISETYRGPRPASEPETRALDGLFRRVGFEFFINYHSAAELLLYGVGWQVSTPTPDDLITAAMAGDDARPAVPGYDPDISAELYTTNGETDGQMENRYGALGFTPEMSTCQTASDVNPDDPWVADDCASVFTFPDDEALIAAEVAKNVPFALSVAASAKDPANPVSIVGNRTPDLVLDPFDVSYGERQPIAVTARRALRDVTLHYRVNGGRERTTGTAEFRGGERYGDENDRYFAERRGIVRGVRPGASVEAWFTARKPGAGTVRSDRFTYTVNARTDADVLVIAAEDTAGISPDQGGGTARYADEHVAALRRAGYSADVYDVSARGGRAPHPLGVLSHYRTVVWETGDDVIPRSAGQVPGTAAKWALDIELAVRDFLNEGGKALVGGKYALFAQGANGAYEYLPDAPPECTATTDPACLPLLNDFQQYYLGAHTYVDDSGTDADGNPYALTGTAGRFNRFAATLNAAGSAANQDHTAAFVTTSSFLPAAEFPLFASAAPVDWQRPGAAPFEPFAGAWYLWSRQSDASYKRLSRTVDLTAATSGRLTFRTSYDLETDWDHLFVEARPVGTEDWTTLPDRNGHTTQDTGLSCPEGIAALHPFIAHYQGAGCTPTGTTGAWHAATGRSNGWTQFDVDLTAYAGRQVEVSITYLTDWANEGLGVFLDDVRVEVGGAAQPPASFESGLDGWTVAGAPAGSPGNGSDWQRSQKAFEEGAVVTTRDTVYLGFGLEGLAPAARDDLVARAMRHLTGRR